jgi:hypothetical protein
MVLGTTSADLVVLFATEPMFDMLQWAWANFTNSPKEADEVASYALNCMDYRQYNITRDEDLEKDLLDALKEFYDNHMVAGAIPASAPVLKDSGGIRTATADEASIILNLKNGYLKNKQGEAEMDVAKELLKQHIGGDSGIDSELGKVTYKLGKKGKVGYKAVADQMKVRFGMFDKAFETLVKSCTSEPTRSFTYPWQRWKKEI